MPSGSSAETGGRSADLAPGAEVTPPDLLEWLMARQFRGSELVAHARIGAHHIFKTKFVGATTVVVQARWVGDAGRALADPRSGGRPRGRGAGGAPGPVTRPGEV